MQKDDIKIGIIGAGRVGRTLGVLLKSKGYNVELVSKTHSSEISDSVLYDIGGDFGCISALIPTYPSVDGFTDKKDYIIFAIRNNDIMDRVKPALKHLKENGACVGIQNVYSLDVFEKLLNNHKFVGMYLDFCSVYASKDRLCVQDFGGVELGIIDKNSYDNLIVLKEIFEEIMQVRVLSDLIGFVASRNILSGAISVLGGICGLSLGEMLEIKHVKKLFNGLIRESMCVFSKLKVKVLPYNEKLDYYLFVENSAKGRAYNRKMINLLIKNNGDVKSSALYDLEKGKKVESNSMLGRFIELGEANGLDMRISKQVHSVLSDVEGGKITINTENLKDKRLKEKK